MVLIIVVGNGDCGDDRGSGGGKGRVYNHHGGGKKGMQKEMLRHAKAATGVQWMGGR